LLQCDQSFHGRPEEAGHLAISQEKNGHPHSKVAPARYPLLSDLSTDDHARLLGAARLKEFSRGDVLYMDGDPVDEVLLLLSGVVKITKIGACGAVVILRLAVPGEALGAANLFSTGVHTVTAEPMRLCRALAWHAPAFKSFVECRPLLFSSILRNLADWLREIEERFHEMATDPVPARVARQLVRLHEKMVPPGNDQVDIYLSQEELAQMTGTNLYTISRLFSEWEDNGFVRSRRRVVSVCEVQSLREIYERS
jgi:CRP-like cAMP-binding protein